jgi:hypothetical protein
VREPGSTKLTAREALGRELDVVMAAREGQNRHAALNGNYRPSSDLTSQQATAVERILASRDFITLLRGGAGTRKVNETIRDRLHDAGRIGIGTVLATSPTRKRSRCTKRESAAGVERRVT